MGLQTKNIRTHKIIYVKYYTKTYLLPAFAKATDGQAPLFTLSEFIPTPSLITNVRPANAVAAGRVTVKTPALVSQLIK